MGERISALFCVGCGRVDVPETCVGACDERTFDLVLAKDYDTAGTQVSAALRQADTLRTFLHRLVAEIPEPGTPAANDWEESRRTLQAEAKLVLHETTEPLEEVDRITAWRCMTCGWTEVPRECLGVCVRDRVQFVEASDYDGASSRYVDAHRHVTELTAVVRQFAWVTPRPGEVERTWISVRSQALAALAP